ncbi:hypothetical protein HDU93_008931 [Gonapodya sp. JEL0774]|nr:hypothetical protein HDU93_008931 [Gonapodya sp. JEL0774]
MDAIQLRTRQEQAILDVFDRTLSHVFSLKTKQGLEVADSFRMLPSQELFPDYYQVIPNPVALDTIADRIRNRYYKSPRAFLTDFQLLADNSKIYNKKGSQIVKDGNMILAAAEDAITREMKSLGLNWDSSFRTGLPSKHDVGRMRELMKRVRQHCGAEGRPLAPTFEHLPTRTDLPDYYTSIAHPLSLSQISTRLSRLLYVDVADLAADLDLCFENAEMYGGEGSEHAVEMRRVAADEAARVKEGVFGGGKSGGSAQVGASIPEGAEEVDVVVQGGEEFREGDSVYIDVSGDRPLIAQIYKTYRKQDGSNHVQVAWFLRPDQTTHHAGTKFYPRELLRTNHFEEYPATSLRGRCAVLWHRDYARGKPVGLREEDTYLYTSKYDEKGKNIYAIKDWARGLPARAREVTLEPRAEPVKMEKTLVVHAVERKVTISTARQREDTESPAPEAFEPETSPAPSANPLAGASDGTTPATPAGTAVKRGPGRPRKDLTAVRPATPANHTRRELRSYVPPPTPLVPAAPRPFVHLQAYAYPPVRPPNISQNPSSMMWPMRPPAPGMMPSGAAAAAQMWAGGAPASQIAYRPKGAAGAAPPRPGFPTAPPAASMIAAMGPQPLSMARPQKPPVLNKGVVVGSYGVPQGTLENFQTTSSGELLWFSTPPLDLVRPASPSHSLDYLHWKLKKEEERQQRGKDRAEEDMEVNEQRSWEGQNGEEGRPAKRAKHETTDGNEAFQSSIIMETFA